MLLQILAGVERGVFGFPPDITSVFLMGRKATENCGIPQRPNVQEPGHGFFLSNFTDVGTKCIRDFQVWVSEYWAWFGNTAISTGAEMCLL